MSSTRVTSHDGDGVLTRLQDGQAPGDVDRRRDGAGITGLVAIIAEHGSKTVVAAMITVWVILAVAGLGTVLLHKYRSPAPGD
jgi:hypothetical protein